MSEAYQDRPPNTREPSSSGSWLPACMISCLVIVILLIVAVGVGGWWIYQRGPAFVARATGDMAIRQVEASEMPEEEKSKVITQIRRLQTATKEDQLGVRDLARVTDRVMNSPLMQLAAVLFVEQKYIRPSGLSDQEKIEGKKTLERVAQGVVQDSITMEQLEPAMELIAYKDESGAWQLKDSVSDETLRLFLDQCKTVADDAGIPDQNFEISIGDEMEKLVDDILSDEPAVPQEEVSPPQDDWGTP